MITTFAIHVERQAGRADARVVAVPAARVQHRVAHGRPYRSPGRLAHDDRRRHRRARRAAHRGAPLQARERAAGREHHADARGVPRSGDDQSRGDGRVADAHHAAGRCVPRAGRGRRARLAHHRDYRHRGQDRRPARGAAAVRRARDGAHGPRGHVARPAQRDHRASRTRCAPPKTITTYFTLYSVVSTQRREDAENSSRKQNSCASASLR